MLYLHSKNMAHGDVHSGNVLIFYEADEIVGKWADFGLGNVGSNKMYRFRMVKPHDMNYEFRNDITGMFMVFWAVLRDRHQGRPETPQEKDLLDQVTDMQKMMKIASSLWEVHQQYKHILEDELDLTEQHF